VAVAVAVKVEQPVLVALAVVALEQIMEARRQRAVQTLEPVAVVVAGQVLPLELVALVVPAS